MKILVGSLNPVKIECVREAFLKYFNNIEVIPIEVSSQVPNQPVNQETYNGAKNRVLELKKINDAKNLKADFFVGIEGGIINNNSSWFAFGGICIMDKKGRMSFSSSSQYPLPENFIKELLKGNCELGDLMDQLTGQKNSKQKDGGVSFLTKGHMTRKSLYVPGLITALIPFMNESLYFNE